ncbi:plasmid pRiA4b ORF-3 family protein [Mycobacterium sp. NPDC003323]
MMIYRVRAELDGSAPRVWRRFDVRSDLPLDVVHLVLQTVFDWENRHLYRFSMAGGPFEADSVKFLCDEDVAEGDDGTPATRVALDTTIRRAGDRLAYVYDYGDCWEVTLELEEVVTALDDVSAVTAIDGVGAAPPEDSRGSKVAGSPFDARRVNNILHGPGFRAITYGVEPELLGLIGRLRAGPVLSHFAEQLPLLSTGPTTVSDAALHANLAAFQWFLDRASDGGIPLTSAGYMKPAEVVAASAALPAMAEWIGKNNRETHCAPLLDFRSAVQSLGLLRKYKGALVLTKLGIAAQADRATLWRHLASRLIPQERGSFERQATMLLFTQAAGAEDGLLNLDVAAAAMSQLGWRLPDGRQVPDWTFYRLLAYDVLMNVSDRPRRFSERDRVSPAAAALARAALRR